MSIVSSGEEGEASEYPTSHISTLESNPDLARLHSVRRTESGRQTSL